MSLDRRRTYLNYLFENMTFLTLLEKGAVYASSPMTIHKGSSNTVNFSRTKFTCTLYSGNLAQYNRYMILPCVYNTYSTNENDYTKANFLVISGINLITNGDLGHDMSTDSKNANVSNDFYDNVSYLGFSDDSITLSVAASGTVYFNSSINSVGVTVLFTPINTSYAIFGINE